MAAVIMQAKRRPGPICRLPFRIQAAAILAPRALPFFWLSGSGMMQGMSSAWPVIRPGAAVSSIHIKEI
ncbi:MAG: hypothetical protein HZT41_18435 [Dechloromonas sp.]|nr:MAG: hypothetical protein HZT41_18435 [Dechloromonas sp.]